MSDSQTKKSLHPLIATAAVSVILLSLVGVAAMTGLLPGSKDEVKQETDTSSLVVDPTKDIVIGANTGASAQSTALKNVSPNKSVSISQTEKVRDEVKVVARPKKSICQECGVVESVNSYEQKAEKGSGVGAVAGAVLGGVIGNQVGGGNGRKLATVAGAVGGGYAGNEIEKSRNTHTVYEVVVKMENGDVRTFKPSNKPDWRSGDRVRLTDGRLVSND
jgi:outer membrane lipoprotein SlyB